MLEGLTEINKASVARSDRRLDVQVMIQGKDSCHKRYTSGQKYFRTGASRGDSEASALTGSLAEPQPREWERN